MDGISMYKVIDQLDSAKNPQKQIWGPLNPDWRSDILDNKLYQGLVLLQQPISSTFLTRKLVLTKTKLYLFSADKESEHIPIGELCLIWKIIKPIQKVFKDNLYSGFEIPHRKIQIQLLCPTQEDAQIWAELFTKTSIQLEYDKTFKQGLELGHGKYSTVYLVKHRQTGEKYAAKEISVDSLKSSSRFTSVLANEVEIMRKLEHQHLAKLNQVFVTDSNLYLITDYIKYGTLLDNLKIHGRFSEYEAQQFIWKLLQALNYMHSMGYMHRDIKPQNILMPSREDRTQFILADFGLSCCISSRDLSPCGTPGYIAPEILQQVAYSSKVDLFSVGVLSYTLLSARSPFNGKSRSAVLEMNKKGIIQFSHRIWKNISANAKVFVMNLMKQNPVMRLDASQALNHPWLFALSKCNKLNLSCSEARSNVKRLRSERSATQFKPIIERQISLCFNMIQTPSTSRNCAQNRTRNWSKDQSDASTLSISRQGSHGNCDRVFQRRDT